MNFRNIQSHCFLVVLFVMFVGMMVFNSCAREQLNETQEGGAVTNRDIKTVMEAHVSDLMEIPGVVAVAIGELEDKTPCIRVYVAEMTEEIKEKVPSKLEGHPVDIEVSGEFKPMSDG